MKNKKVGIITIHYGINYGSVLQTYATYKYLSDKDFEPEIINYIPKRYSRWKVYTMTPGNKNLLFKLIYIILVFPYRFCRRIRFKKFLKRNIKLSKEYNCVDAIRKNNKKYDLLIAGSDQIWNSDYNKIIDPVYYLDFANDSTYKFALAGSFGKKELSNEEFESTKKFLSKFDYITVRENTAFDICKNLGFNNVKHVLDPTFLLTKDEWKKTFNKYKNINTNEKYLLVYVMDNDYNKVIDVAYSIAQKRNLKVYLIAFKKQNNKKIDKCFGVINPEDFIQLFYNAEYVVTNSFHGVAFSINFEKQFIAIKREKYNTRLESILQVFNLENRFISNNEDFIVKDIDYKIVSDKINEERRKLYNSIEKDMIEKVNNNE